MFAWPGPDLRAAASHKPPTIWYGPLPPKLATAAREKLRGDRPRRDDGHEARERRAHGMSGAAAGHIAVDASRRFVSRQGPILAGEPAPVGEGRAPPDQAADGLEAAGVEGGAQSLKLFGIGLEFSLGADEIGRADGARRVGVAAPFDPERRAAVAVAAAGIRPLGAGRAEREDEPAAWRQALDPTIGPPGHGEIHINAVDWGFGPAGAVASNYAHVGAAGKEGLGPLGQSGVELDCRDLAGGVDQLGQDRAIVAGAGADMDDALARLRAEGLDELGARRRAGC